MTEEVMNLAVTYIGKDVRQINHLLKVFSFAHLIGKMEKCNIQEQTIIDIAALLHDIGINEAERKHNSSDYNFQEQEGPVVAREMLKGLNLDTEILERVLFLIGNHHTYKAIDGIDFQIMVEADFLVNIFEHAMDIKAIAGIKEELFKTKTGKRLLEQLYM